MENIIKTDDDSGEIKLKSRNDLQKKSFFDIKENKYRVKKLIKMVDILNRPDFDIELDELKFTKLKKYKEYSLVKVTEEELKKILSNYDLREQSYLSFLGISKLENDSYSLQLDIFLEKFIRINLKEITFEENLEVIFKMFDKDNNGIISKNEATDLLIYFNEISNLVFDKGTVKIITESIYKEIDKSNRGSISKEALKKYLEKFKDEDITINPFIKVKTSDAVTRIKKKNTLQISDEQQKELERITRKKDRSKIKKFWVLNRKMIIWSIIYFALCNVAGIVNRALEGGRQYETTKAARYFAGIIFFNLSLLITFMCNVPLTFISTTRLKFFLPLSDTKYYHAVCGCVLGIAAIAHILIHIFGDFRQIANICATKADKKYVTVAWLTFANLTGITGIFCTIIFSIVLIVPLIPYFREKRYEIFLHTHKLFYLALIVLCLHARTPDTKRWSYFIFLILPLLLFTIELIFRLTRYFTNKTQILKAKYLTSGVIMLQIKKPKNFNYCCGQYAQICIPAIKKYQYHPFTFASSPEDDHLYFYINPVGDWTKELKNLGKKNKNDLENDSNNRDLLIAEQEKDMIVYVDGPFGAPAEHFKNYQNLIFVAAGVGVTPFSSILISLLYQLKKGEKINHKTISFYWIQREYGKVDYLNNVLEEIANEDKERLFEINVFITCAQQKYDLRSLFLSEGIEIAKKDAKGKSFSQICFGNVFWGRPEWEEIFKEKTLKFRTDEQTRVGVFVCGNNTIVNDIYEVCENFSSAAVIYDLNTEHF